MEADLRELIGKYGLRAVHEAIMKEMQDTFQYLQSVFLPKAMKSDVADSIASITRSLNIIGDVIPTVDTSPASTVIDSVEEDSSPPVEEEGPKDPTIKEIVIGNPKQKIIRPASADVKQQKAKHREEVDKKRQDLIEKGVKPETLLTEVNLRKWLNDGWSYLKIAKETGVHEAIVANTAKSFGLQSNISKYVAMKKK
jgi:hypothetical protein